MLTFCSNDIDDFAESIDQHSLSRVGEKPLIVDWHASSFGSTVGASVKSFVIKCATVAAPNLHRDHFSNHD